MNALKSFFWDAFVNGLLASRIVGYRLRGFFLNRLGCRVPRDSAVHSGCYITGRRLSMGHGSYINRNCLLDCNHAEVVIGDRVGIAYSCQFLTTRHDYGNPVKRTGAVRGGRIEVGDGVWVGGCFDMPRRKNRVRVRYRGWERGYKGLRGERFVRRQSRPSDTEIVVSIGEVRTRRTNWNRNGGAPEMASLNSRKRQEDI